MPNYGHLSLSCAKIERPSPLEKPSCKVRLFAQNRFRKYRQKVTGTTLFQTVFQFLSQAAHVRLHPRKRVHTRLSEKDRTQGHTRRNRAFPPSSTAGLCAASEIALSAAFVTPDSATLLYTYISRFSVTPHYQQQFYLRPSFITFFNFSHKRPTFAFTGESGYTLGFAQRIAHNGSHGETGGVSDGALSLPSTRTARSRTSPGRVSERQTLPLLGLGRRCSQRTQKAFGTAMRLCASLFRRRRGPAGLRDLFRFCRNCGLYALHSGSFRVCEAWVVSLPSACFACF